MGLSVAGRALSLPHVRRLVERSLRGTTDDHLLGVAASWRRGESWRSFVVEQRALVDELGRLAPGLAGIRVPVTVLVGEADRVVPAPSGRRLASAIPGAVLIQLAGAGHLLTHERPAEVAAAITQMAATGR